MKYYAVRTGRQVGVYTTWPEAQQQVQGYPNAVFKSFVTRAEADEFMGVRLRVKIDEPVVSSKNIGARPCYTLQLATLPPLERTPRQTTVILYSDGGHSKQTGREGWGRVVDQDGVDLLAPYANLFTDQQLRDVLLPIGQTYVLVALFPDVVKQQNNGAELLGLVAALRIAMIEPTISEIRVDSMVILSWSLGLGSDTRGRLSEAKIRLIEECQKLRRVFEGRGGRLVKISGDDNKADNGFHRRR